MIDNIFNLGCIYFITYAYINSLFNKVWVFLEEIINYNMTNFFSFIISKLYRLLINIIHIFLKE